MEVGFSNGVAGIDSVPEIVGVLGTAWNAFVRALGDMGVTGVIVLNLIERLCANVERIASNSLEVIVRARLSVRRVPANLGSSGNVGSLCKTEASNSLKAVTVKARLSVRRVPYNCLVLY